VLLYQKVIWHPGRGDSPAASLRGRLEMCVRFESAQNRLAGNPQSWLWRMYMPIPQQSLAL